MFDTSLRDALGLPDSMTLHGLQFDADEVFAEEANFPLPDRVRRASPKRRREFLAGRLCASAALAQAGYAGPSWLAQGADALPVWPDGWSGSISHSASAALAAVCPDAAGFSVGVDVERIVLYDDVAGIASMVARPGELAVLSTLPATHAVILLLSAKESLYKALYPSLRTFRDFTAARLVEAGDGHLVLRLEEDWGTGWPAGRRVRVRHARRRDHVVTAFQATRVPVGVPLAPV